MQISDRRFPFTFYQNKKSIRLYRMDFFVIYDGVLLNFLLVRTLLALSFHLSAFRLLPPLIIHPRNVVAFIRQVAVVIVSDTFV